MPLNPGAIWIEFPSNEDSRTDRRQFSLGGLRRSFVTSHIRHAARRKHAQASSIHVRRRSSCCSSLNSAAAPGRHEHAAGSSHRHDQRSHRRPGRCGPSGRDGDGDAHRDRRRACDDHQRGRPVQHPGAQPGRVRHPGGAGRLRARDEEGPRAHHRLDADGRLRPADRPDRGERHGHRPGPARRSDAVGRVEFDSTNRSRAAADVEPQPRCDDYAAARRARGAHLRRARPRGIVRVVWRRRRT